MIALHVLVSAGTAQAGYNIVVAQDGTGDYTTVQAGILAVPEHKATRTTIFIKRGTYREKIKVPKGRGRITLIGEDRDTTILAYDDHAIVYPDQSTSGTLTTPSFTVSGKDFGARNLTFSNTAGNVGPAIALATLANHAHFRNCAFLGYQDTIANYGHAAYFKRCYIEGAIDFIFGAGTVVFQRCTIHCLDAGAITASETPPDEKYGYVFKGCTIYGDAPGGSVSLGRPLTAGAKIVYSNCVMDDEIAADGWSDYLEYGTDGTTFFAEYNSSGGGADPADRVDWSQQLAASDVEDYTLRNIFHLPAAPSGTMFLLATSPAWYADY